MNKFEANKELRFAIDLVTEAAELAVQIQRELVPQALQKEDRSPVTVADFAVQALIAMRLAEAYPEIPLVAEESVESVEGPAAEKIFGRVVEFVSRVESTADSTAVRQWINRGQSDLAERFWVLDPIDGTKGFLRAAQYAIALALVQEGRVILGVVGCPRLSSSSLLTSGDKSNWKPASNGTLLAAARGQGAYANRLGENHYIRLRVSDCVDPAQAVLLRSVESSHTDVGRFDEITRRLGVSASPILLDSMAKYALLAAGKGELMFRLISPSAPNYREKIWDHAAGVLVVEEAGGRVTDLDGKELDFSVGRKLLRNRGLVGSNGRLHAEALQAVEATSEL